ncbi:MAG: Hsp20/alpha crystallin family protein [Candidatus Heimdallarchaeota archaeon]
MAEDQKDLDVRRSDEPRSMARRRSPWGWMSDFDSILTDFRRNFDEMFWGEPIDRFRTIPRAAVTDIIQKDSEYVIQAELPGLDKEDIKIEVDKQYLTIRGERKTEKEEKGEGYLRQERSYGAFSRQIALPQDVLLEKEIKATLEKGILEITVPRKPEKPKRTIDIK